MRHFVGRYLLVAALAASAPPAHADHHEMSEEAQAIAAARVVMDQFMAAFNSRDVVAWAETLLFPHVRVAGSGVSIVDTKAEFVAQTDLEAFARIENWDHSAWDTVEVIQAGPDKVHFKVRFDRFNPEGENYVSYDSLYVVQKVDGRWGVRARSSYAGVSSALR